MGDCVSRETVLPVYGPGLPGRRDAGRLTKDDGLMHVHLSVGRKHDVGRG